MVFSFQSVYFFSCQSASLFPSILVSVWPADLLVGLMLKHDVPDVQACVRDRSVRLTGLVGGQFRRLVVWWSVWLFGGQFSANMAD